jgi:hypothetical protein
MLISEMIEHLKETIEDNGDEEVWFLFDGGWAKLIKNDMTYDDGDNGEEPGLYIG